MTATIGQPRISEFALDLDNKALQWLEVYSRPDALVSLIR
jgi:hypothetical protein